MRRSKIKILTAFFCLFSGFFVKHSCAEIITLKDGRSVDCRVLERNNDYIKVDYRGAILVYFDNEVVKITDNGSPNIISKPILPLAVNDELLNRSFYVVLVSSERIGKTYINRQPVFSLSIPDNAARKWSFFKLKAPGGKFYIVDEEVFSKVKSSHPRIDCLVQQIPSEAVGKSPEELFSEISESYKNRNTNGDIIVVNNGSPLADINGLKAFERLEEIASQDARRHLVFVFFDKYFLAAQLNTKIIDFSQDDQDFMSIMKTISAKTE